MCNQVKLKYSPPLFDCPRKLRIVHLEQKGKMLIEHQASHYNVDNKQANRKSTTATATASV